MTPPGGPPGGVFVPSEQVPAARYIASSSVLISVSSLRTG